MAHWIFPLYTQSYAQTEVRITLIAHRQKTDNEAAIMIKQIRQAFATSQVVEGNMLAETYEIVMHSIKTAGYMYNHDCFVGLEFVRLVKGKYVVDEVPEHLATEEMVIYLQTLVETYSPLYVLDPLHTDDYEGLLSLENKVGEKTFIGATYSSTSSRIGGSLVAVAVHNTHHLKDLKPLVLKLHSQSKKIIVIVDEDLSADDLAEVTLALNPDFLEALI